MSGLTIASTNKPTESAGDIDPTLVKDLPLLEWNIKAEAEVEVNVFAYAYGLSDKWTAGIIVPVVDARTNLRGGFSEQNAIQNLQNRLNELESSYY